MNTVEEFLEVLRDNRILQPDQLQMISRAAPGLYTSARALSKNLLQRGWLTVYQVNQLFQGKAQDLVIGPYIVIDRLGEGGVSQVFKAWDTRRKCVAALKAIRSEHFSNEEAINRFRREMRVIAQLSHPNIVKAFDIELDHPRHYFAMEYIDGIDLIKHLRLNGPLPPNRACDFIRQAALGLQHAHERGLVHRDIKPANLYVTGGGSTIKILDFGMARLHLPSESLPDGQASLTVEGMMIGTPDYLAPEQARNPKNVDIRADIYSLGCTLYHILFGEPPFPGQSVMVKLFKHQQEQPSRLSEASQEELAKVMRKMMAKKPEERFQTPLEVAEALAPFVGAD